MKNEVFRRLRVAFVIQSCPQCRIIKPILEKINSNLMPDKQIKVVECTRYHDLGVIEHPLIKLYNKYIRGEYPVIFLEGSRIDGAGSTEMVKAFLETYLYEDFIIKPSLTIETKDGYIGLTFNKECQYVKRGIFGKKLICQ